MLIDTNIHLGRWPFRRLALDETPALVAKLKQFGVTQAWAGSYDALLHRDVTSVNERLVRECDKRGEGILIPFGTVNPALPDWEGDLRRCAVEYQMKGIRLYPNYHGYLLDDERGHALLKMATEAGLLIQIAVMMEDERTQHPLIRLPHVSATPLLDFARKHTGCRIQLLNSFRGVRTPLAVQLAATGRVFFETSTLEGVAGIENLLKLLPEKHLLFGTGAPFYIFESAILKMRESRLKKSEFDAIAGRNAISVLRMSKRQ